MHVSIVGLFHSSSLLALFSSSVVQLESGGSLASLVGKGGVCSQSCHYESVCPTEPKAMAPLSVSVCEWGVGWGWKGRVFCSHSAILVDPRGSFGNLEIIFLELWQ